jgi:hypothetical protein
MRFSNSIFFPIPTHLDTFMFEVKICRIQSTRDTRMSKIRLMCVHDDYLCIPVISVMTMMFVMSVMILMTVTFVSL